MRNSTAVVLVASNVLFGDGLSRIIRSAGFKIAACAPSVEDYAVTAAMEDASTILVVDLDDVLQMSTHLNHFMDRHPDTKVAVIIDDSKLLTAMTVFQERVHAYIRRNCTYQSFIKVLELIVLGERFIPSVVLPGSAEAMASLSMATPDTPVGRGLSLSPESLHDEIGGLFSAQEERILRLIVEGQSNKVIARSLQIAEATVKVHVKAILRKLQVSNRTQAAIWAVSNRVASGCDLAIPH